MIHVALVAPALALRAGLTALLSAGEGVQVVKEGAALVDVLPLPPETSVLLLATVQDPLSELRKALRDHEGLSVLFLVPEESTPLQLPIGLSPHPWGVLPLESSTEELLAAIQALNEGLIVGTPSFLEPFIIHQPEIEIASGTGSEDTLMEPLTERESQVLGLIAQGLANKQIALTLGISEHTVKFHISSIYSKLGAASRTEAVRLGVLQGLVAL